MPARFQTFDDPSDGAASGPRVTALRGEMARHGLDGFIVPRADRYQNEYVPPSDERLAWICGFTGSAGTAIVLADHAALFVDGRYTLQAPSRSTPRCSRSSISPTPRPTNGSRRRCTRARSSASTRGCTR